MAKSVFINLAVKDLTKSMQFFADLGYTIDQNFTDDTAACVIISDTIYAMLLTEEKFKEFTKKDIADAHKVTEVLIALTTESREAVDILVDRALSLGATEARDAEVYDFMYGRSFEDLDGHIWEVVWMDPTRAAA